ncbi:hypothetical protein [Marinicella litoralis]|uniref:Uncharacterized protein n=1 Tax=Marinicella litoralis TaxID=644220 RepID=A0A4R6XI59_9GAMM|nr:hypothetical protein [Marinicella litoralis]TDR17580.1 hypothetical protein C8D91_2639 [Marinicella litoralis]
MKLKPYIFITLLSIYNISISAIFVDIGWKKQIEESDYIVKGKIIDIEVRNHEYTLNAFTILNGEKIPFAVNKNSPHTFYTVEIEEVLKGVVKENHLTIIKFGGCINGVCERVSTTYDFDLNDDCLMLLKKGSDGYFHARNGSYDMFTVTANNQIKRKAGNKMPGQFEYANEPNSIQHKVIENMGDLRDFIKQLNSEKK